MTRTTSPKLATYAALAALGLLAALALGRPELVALAAPFALVAAAGVALARTPDVSVALSLGRERALEGDEVAVELALRGRPGAPEVELVLAVPHGLALVEGENPLVLALGDAEDATLVLRCERWGAYALGEVHARARDRLGLFRWERSFDLRTPLRVYPREETLRGLVAPRETQVYTGNRVSRTKGEGIEFADIRPFVPGDRVRRINWRASARRSGLWVNVHHPERNADVILFLDSFAEARRGRIGTLDLAVRAAASLGAEFVRHRDRVGLVGFGGVLRWLEPGAGMRQLYRIVDSLLETEISLSYAWKGIGLIPPRTLPPQALVLALSPLLDERAVRALLDLRARGFDLVVVDVSPAAFVPEPRDELDELALRLWLLKREALRARYQREGVAVVEWREGEPLAGSLEEVIAFRRSAHRLRA